MRASNIVRLPGHCRYIPEVRLSGTEIKIQRGSTEILILELRTFVNY